MEYSEKIKRFMDVKGLNQRDLANKLGKQEVLISRWVNAEKPSLEFMLSMSRVFPDFDLNYMLRDKPAYDFSEDVNHAAEELSHYEKSPADIIEDIQQRLDVLKEKVAQNCHK